MSEQEKHGQLRTKELHRNLQYGGYSHHIIEDDGRFVARVKGERLARQFAASDEMLAVLKAQIAAAWTEGEDGYIAQRAALARAQKIVERLEQGVLL